MCELKEKRKALLHKWENEIFELDSSHNRLTNKIKFYQIGDDLIAKHRQLKSAYDTMKREIEARFQDPQCDPSDDAVQKAKKELTLLLEQEEEFAEHAKLKDKQKKLLDEWTSTSFDFDRSHNSIVTRIKFCQLNDDLETKFKEILTSYVQLKQDIQKRFEDPQYDPPRDAVEVAKKEMEHQLKRQMEFAERARLKDKHTVVLDEWKIIVEAFDKKYDLTMNQSLEMCNFLKMVQRRLVQAYTHTKLEFEIRFEDPLYDPPANALETVKKKLSYHLERQEEFVDHVKKSCS